MAKNVDIKIEFPNLINKLKSLKVKDDRYESSLFFDENYLSFKILDKENPERHTLNGWLDKGTYKEFILPFDINSYE